MNGKSAGVLGAALGFLVAAMLFGLGLTFGLFSSAQEEDPSLFVYGSYREWEVSAIESWEIISSFERNSICSVSPRAAERMYLDLYDGVLFPGIEPGDVAEVFEFLCDTE